MMLSANDGAIGIVGCGKIGAGWAATFLSDNRRIIAWDTDPEAETRLRTELERVWPDLVSLGRANGKIPHDQLQFVQSLDQLSDVVFVQENAPDDDTLKANLLRELDDILPPSVLIASSTSGIQRKDLSALCAHPDRILVGHPFLPVHLMPLLEIVAANDDVAAQATSFYESLGKKVIVLKKDVVGFIANRLQETIWREALHMIDSGEATAEQIDLAITEGPGLRWAFMGPIQSYDLAWGPSGMADLVRLLQEDPEEEEFSRTPLIDISDPVAQDLIESAETLKKGLSFSDRCARRDRLLIDILAAKARN